MSAPRDTYKYHLKTGNKIVYAGITEDIERREDEHRRDKGNVRAVKVGHRTTLDAARKWEQAQQKRGTPITK